MGRLGLWLATVVMVALGLGAGTAVARTDGSVPAPASVTRLVTGVPASTLNRVGAGDLESRGQGFDVSTLHADLTQAGKPELLSLNLAWCPHCAANSWGLAVALSRFGRLSGLRELNTGTYYCTLTSDPCALSPSKCFPDTDGLSFLDARLHSPYLSFVAVVFQTVTGRTLEQPTRPETAAMNSFDPEGQTPAVDVGGRFSFVSSAYSPGDLAHRTWAQIAGSLADPHNALARHIDGLANLFSAAICRIDGGRPKAVCTSHGVIAAGDRRLH